MASHTPSELEELWPVRVVRVEPVDPAGHEGLAEHDEANGERSALDEERGGYDRCHDEHNHYDRREPKPRAMREGRCRAQHASETRQPSQPNRTPASDSLPESLPSIHQVREGPHRRPRLLPHRALDVRLRPVMLPIPARPMRDALPRRHATHDLHRVRHRALHAALPLLLHLRALLLGDVRGVRAGRDGLPRGGREREAPERADDVARLLLDGLALVPLRCAGEAVGAPERACAGHLEVARGGGDGGEWCGWEEECARGRVEDQCEERAAEEGAEEVVPPGEVVGLEYVREALGTWVVRVRGGRGRTRQNNAVRRGSFHERMRAMCFQNAARLTIYPRQQFPARVCGAEENRAYRGSGRIAWKRRGEGRVH